MYATDMSEYGRDLANPAGPRADVGFLFIGGVHHILHLAPVAVELARRQRCRVHLFAGSGEEAARLRQLLIRLGSDLAIEMLPTPSWARIIPRFRPSWTALKLPRIYAGRRRLAEMDVLVTAERTSTMLKRLPGRAPRLVHIPHGAGDRARGFEPRMKLFDHVIAAGRKDRDRMIAQGLVAPANCSVSGYVKLAAILSAQRRLPGAKPLFDNGCPIVLYNPHFAPDLSSWAMFGEALVRWATTQSRYNLIVAPHVRLAEALSADERHAIEALSVPGRVLVDLGSERSCDMTYTLSADVYVGDVSSQVYEFLHRPRPCLFLNATGGDRRDDRSFAFWSMGEVIDAPAALPAAIERAAERHAEFAALQVRAVREAFGPPGVDAVGEAARIIARLASDARGRVAAVTG